MAVTAVLVLAVAGTAHAWGGLFNRFSSDMLANLGYGRSGYRHYPYGQVRNNIYTDLVQSVKMVDLLVVFHLNIGVLLRIRKLYLPV